MSTWLEASKHMSMLISCQDKMINKQNKKFTNLILICQFVSNSKIVSSKSALILIIGVIKSNGIKSEWLRLAGSWNY